MAVTFSVTMAFSQNMFNNSVTSVKSRERMYNKLSEIDRYARANEYFDIDEDTLNDTIASGYMLGISDRYARYYSVQQYSRADGHPVGAPDGQSVCRWSRIPPPAMPGFSAFMKTLPAAEVGMQEGGFLTSIGDTSLRSLSDTSAVQSALLGEEGSTVSIGYLAPDHTEQDLHHHPPPTIPTATVFSQMHDGNCAYIDIDDFSATTGTEFRSAVDDMRGQGCHQLCV